MTPYTCSGNSASFPLTRSTGLLKTANLVLWHGSPFAMHAEEALVEREYLRPSLPVTGPLYVRVFYGNSFPCAYFALLLLHAEQFGICTQNHTVCVLAVLQTPFNPFFLARDIKLLSLSLSKLTR